MSNIEILEANYWEHFKHAKEISLYLPLKHPRRVRIETEMNRMIENINKIKKAKQ